MEQNDLIIKTMFEIKDNISNIREGQAMLLQRVNDNDQYLKGVVTDIADRLDKHDVDINSHTKWQIEATPQLGDIECLKKWQNENEPYLKKIREGKDSFKKWTGVFIGGLIGGVAVLIANKVGSQLLSFILNVITKSGGN